MRLQSAGRISGLTFIKHQEMAKKRKFRPLLLYHVTGLRLLLVWLY